MPILPPIPAEGPPTLGVVGDDGLITAKRRTRGPCPRHAFLVNEDDRTVKCKRCEKMFDSIEALLYLASWPDRWRAEVTHLNRQIKAKTAVLDELARKLTNYKAAARKRGVAVPSEWDALRSVPASAPPKAMEIGNWCHDCGAFVDVDDEDSCLICGGDNNEERVMPSAPPKETT